MDFSPRSEDEEAQAITRLVDGSASDRERSALEAWAAQRPDIARRVERQHHVSGQLQIGGPPVPPGLVAAVRERASATERVSARRAGSSSAWSAARWRPFAVAGAALVAVVAVVVGLQVSGAGGSPSITRAAQLAFAPSTHPPPAARTAKLLDVSYAGITYPNYARQFGVMATGQRADRLGGRPALTVFYRLADGARLSYTVFSGKPVPRPAAAKAAVFDGVPLHVFSTPSGLAVVTLVRFGRTCVLAAPTARDAVLALAAAPVRADHA